MKQRECGLLGKRRRDRTLEEWHLVLANREDRMRRLRDLNVPEMLIENEQELIDEARKWIARFDPITGMRTANEQGDE